MTLAQKLEQVLKGELKPENIKTVIDLAEFLKDRESQNKWNEINESEHEFIRAEEQSYLEEVKANGQFIDQDELLKELVINTHKQNEPIFITKNGYGDLVIMSMETYERKLALVEVYKKLAEAENQIAKGVPLLDGEEVFAKLKERYVNKE